MEENHEFRFVCKLCYKKYPNGKSLGVHMKSHVMLASSDEKPAYPNSPNKEKNPGYVLRENPKRSWRTAPPMANDHHHHHHHHEDKLMICRQCGKGFPSLKALCGHMACHSDRERGLKENDSSSSNTDHTESDTESDSSRRRQMMRYNKGNIIDNCSSSCSEMIDHEQEELALCLMMLSRESGKWVNITSSFDSDSNNTKVPPPPRGQGIVQSVNSDSGYFMNETEKVESDVSSGGFYKVKASMEEGPSKKNKKKKKEASLSVYKSRGKKKKKGHVCPICDKVYMSGQALGGHKRSHFLVSSEERNNRGGSLSKIKTTTRRNFFDLNFPPPAEE
ncbi:zinc finger protein ZAT1-like [Impatiens glandulifera]|uniref:zinc finger protein ZAT1-like n=1 Tax=Impatiens glandulifera TaxID=253017 RepID=UPI001FB0BE0B|nr:zinc finger protein ZAT1-like [Impatiens glandulifera]